MPNYGAFSANTIQLGREATAGTALAATAIWRGPANDIEDARVIIAPDESVGILAPTSRTYIAQHAAMLSIPDTELTFEQVGHILDAGIEVATPGIAPNYQRAYAYPVNATAKAIKTYTIETGNTIAGDGNRMSYAFVESFTLSGRVGEAWKVSSNWRGRTKTANALTAALAVPAVEEALFSKTQLYIDAEGGTIGTTVKAGVLLEASVQVTTGIVPVFTGDGALHFTQPKNIPPTIQYTLTMELESDAAVATERTAHQAQTVRLIRLRCAGSAATKQLTIDLAGKHTSFGGYQNSNGNTTVQVSGEAKYSSVASLFFVVDLLSGVATL
jgi:hypothetical protein